MTDYTARTVEISVSHAEAILRKLRIVASVYTGDKETRLTLVPAMEAAIAAWNSRAPAPDERADAERFQWLLERASIGKQWGDSVMLAVMGLHEGDPRTYIRSLIDSDRDREGAR